MLVVKQSAITINELISLILSNIDNIGDKFCIYASEYLEEIPLGMEIYVDEYPNEDED